MFKKGDISLNMIILAIIALLVLVIIAAVFTGRLAIFNLGISDCLKIKNAECEPISCDAGYVEDRTSKCIQDGKPTNEVCCLPQDYSEMTGY
ncbi:hypothetical protein HN695_01235 [Candidatus Woesearchaeota archaeon]|jgi:hypothetical protein|nr:hypothetical protein [Candidatus Woesearchaeota archaeon]MBT5273024.1 hypothetical protein [Candidatus Woesearchaeota archaeon]MBT6040840.1 hypothetical protein [Candidatus Woesearchaeota archaeon]MBT6336727.1 hypothetical protein [Candidatus Woesearchaeota archaeon]MBT7926938.1 hypothetical protein [Candidatus Woesearchaeota archaeon]